MACFRPLHVYPAAPDSKDRRPVFSAHKSYAGAQAFVIPCGACEGCRLGRSRDWGTRLHHEASLHEHSVFLTPTYADEHLPDDLSVSVRTHQLFIKRCRAALGPLRFFGCGEYGGQLRRPHYHTILFGVDFADKRPWSKSGTGNVLYRSPTLEKLWPYGHCLIGSVTRDSAAYCARYCLKKVGGEAAADQYERSVLDPVTGEVRTWQVKPEFVVMSRRPGIGAVWFERFSEDAFPSDFVVIDGQKVSVPRFYVEKLRTATERGALGLSSEVLQLKHERRLNAARHASNNSDERLAVREEVSRLRTAHYLRRELEEGL